MKKWRHYSLWLCVAIHTLSLSLSLTYPKAINISASFVSVGTTKVQACYSRENGTAEMSGKLKK